MGSEMCIRDSPTYLGLCNRKYNYKCYDALATKTEAIDLLHRTLGHVSVQRLEEWVKTGVIDWKHESEPVRFKNYSSPCVSCALAKSKRSPHTKHIVTPLEPGKLFYVDVWGPCETPSLIHSNVYTIGFIDAASKRAWLYQRKRKSCLLYTSPSPRDGLLSRMPSSA